MASTTISQSTEKKGPFTCPFPSCGLVINKSYNMKVHLNLIKSQNGNETHPIDSPIWEECDLKINQRPGNLTEKEVKVLLFSGID
jgi:hypothetical protein